MESQQLGPPQPLACARDRPAWWRRLPQKRLIKSGAAAAAVQLLSHPKLDVRRTSANSVVIMATPSTGYSGNPSCSLCTGGCTHKW